MVLKKELLKTLKMLHNRLNRHSKELHRSGNEGGSMVLKEELFENLLKILQHQLNRDPKNYRFLIRSESDRAEDSPFLEPFMEAENIPFTGMGVNLISQSLLPAMSFVETKWGRMPVGMYLVYPESADEIIIYLYQDIGEAQYRDSPRCIIGYRNEKTMEEFFSQCRGFAVSNQRECNTIKVFRGKDIERPELSWDDLILPFALKTDIKWHVETFMAGESAYKRLGVPYKRGFLFIGPPGNGKTMLLKVISSNFPEWKFIYFNASIRTDNEDVDEVFALARDLAPSILCVEDLDTLFNSDVTISHFLNKLDGFETMNGNLILATTNHPEKIDEALTNRPSRFDRVWIIDNPDKNARRLFIERHFPYLESDNFTGTLAANTEGFSMTYMKELYVSASLLAIERGLEYPGEEEVMASLQTLSLQITGAKNDFIRTVKTIGFAAG
ncbi:MAG: hypothetical protein C0392_12465 [Syntrophus sp. (in: bacteria)]|nr:hypothetical protein [Syntrophus sp. (in: bacteria)]